MRNSEELAYALFKAWADYNKYEDVAQSFDELSEDAQQGYLAEVNAAFQWLFEHGRISSYINVEQLVQAREEYRAYLQAKSTKNPVPHAIVFLEEP